MKERASKAGVFIFFCLILISVGLACNENDTPNLSSPFSLTAIPFASGQINLNWPNTLINTTSFAIERKAGGDGVWSEIATVNANISLYSDLHLVASTTYYYRIRAYQAKGGGVYSSIASAKTAFAGMSAIPSGCFNMGDAVGGGGRDESPVHKVCLHAFNIDIHEVTNAEFEACVNGGGCSAPSISYTKSRDSYYGDTRYNDFPVIFISWNQASAYCTWAKKRLPTEAEWEYAAEGGGSGKDYPWGDLISCSNANYERFNSSSQCWNYAGLDNDTQRVGSYAANSYGIFDMTGNVSEWVNDFYNIDYYADRPIPDNDPSGPSKGSYRVVRGGSYYNLTYFLRVSFRDSAFPSTQNPFIGFRCAAD